MIGIIAALEKEVVNVKAQMKDSIKINHSGMDFIKGKIDQKEVVAVKSGVGKVNAAICTQVLIDLFKVKMVINLGVAGAVNSDLDVGDLVISEDSCQYDMDARAFGHPWGEIPNMDITYFKADPTLIRLAENIAVTRGFNYVRGRVMSADLGVDSIELKKKLWDEFQGDCVEMEGGAIGQVAYINQIPYLIVRSISDKADGNLSVDYKKNLEESIKRGVELVLELIKGL